MFSLTYESMSPPALTHARQKPGMHIRYLQTKHNTAHADTHTHTHMHTHMHTQTQNHRPTDPQAPRHPDTHVRTFPVDISESSLHVWSRRLRRASHLQSLALRGVSEPGEQQREARAREEGDTIIQFELLRCMPAMSPR